MKRLNLTPKQYRKLLVNGTKVVEQKMCAKKWNEIEYSKIPSVAINKYNKAWYRNDKERFEGYINDVKKGKTKINASVILPSDIIKQVFKSAYSNSNLTEAQITQWNALPNYLQGENSIIPVCDVSDSMWLEPMIISVALGLYISERNVGPFKDAFITFSESPEIQVLKGNINERLHQLQTASWGFNTNLAKTFQVILSKATSYNLPAEQMPKIILIISDMEFDYCSEEYTNFKYIKQLYKQSGYECPQVIFWNVNGRVGNVPITKYDHNVALISGANPNIIRSVLQGDIAPEKIMNRVIESERYKLVRI